MKLFLYIFLVLFIPSKNKPHQEPEYMFPHGMLGGGKTYGAKVIDSCIKIYGDTTIKTWLLKSVLPPNGKLQPGCWYMMEDGIYLEKYIGGQWVELGFMASNVKHLDCGLDKTYKAF